MDRDLMTASAPLPDPQRLHFLPIGTGNAFTRTRFNSSFLVLAGGKSLLIDAPAPLRRVLWEAEKTSGIPLDLDSIDALFLTHLHGDHCNGLEELGFYRLFLSEAPPPRLLLHQDLAAPLWDQRLRAAMGGAPDPHGGQTGLHSFFTVETFQTGRPIDTGIPGLELEARWTNHMVPCTAVKIRFGASSIAYSADTGFDPELIAWMDDCDVLIHEVGPGLGHTPLENLLGLAADVRARLYLTHLSDDFPVGPCGLKILEEGRLYPVERCASGVSPVQ